MLKKLKVMKNEKGMTLIELLAVIVIIAIVAAIAIPAIGNIIENSRYNAVKSDALNAINAAALYYTDTPEGEAAPSIAASGSTEASVTVQQLIQMKYLDNAGKIPGGATITNAKPHALSATEIVYSGTKKVTFSGATITVINADKQKGSADSNKTVAPATPAD